MIILRVLQVFILLLITKSITADRTLINTTSGPVRGIIVNKYGVQYYSYRGIPYAENPTGNRRFKPPVPVTPWTEERDATSFGPVCPQPEGPYTRDQMSEDCLVLNIYVPAHPKNSSTELIPVLVYIHSGNFKKYSSNPDYQYGPELLLKRDIIVVTVNYRLGALGFLSLGIKDASGNAGLKDVLLALKWINANIHSFGGSRNNITLGGQSSGASLTHYMILTRKSTGLFNRAMMLSGSALIFRHLALNPKAYALALAKQLDIQSTESTEILEELKKKDIFDIIQAQQAIGTNNTRKGFIDFSPFVPTIEIEHNDAIITQAPRHIIKAGVPQNVPLLIGSNTDEGLSVLPDITKNPVLVDYLNENFELCIPTDIEYPYGSQESIQLAKEIKNFYFDGADISNFTIPNYIKLVTDATYSYGVDAWVKMYTNKTWSNKVYYRVFGFDGELNWFKVLHKINSPGTAHADDLGYIFVTNATKSKLDSLDLQSEHMLDTMTTVITNFVKFGDPTPQKEDIGLIWLAATERRNHLKMNNCGLRNIFKAPNIQRLNFWYNVYNNYNQYLENGGETQKKGFNNIEYK